MPDDVSVWSLAFDNTFVERNLSDREIHTTNNETFQDRYMQGGGEGELSHWPAMNFKFNELDFISP